MNKEILLTEAKEVRQKLTSYPGEIYKLRKEKQEIENQITTFKENLEICKVNIENKVFSFFQGKKSNQEQRKAKFTELAKDDEDYNEVAKKLKDLEIRKNSIEIEIERLYNEFKATREQTKILVAELNLIGGEEEDENNRNRESWFTF